MREMIHKWEYRWAGNSLSYICTRCGFVTLPGEPLPAPYNKECPK